MKKITIIALHLGYGGIEKAIASLANMLCNSYEVNIIATYKLYDRPSFTIDERVKISYLINDKPNKKEWSTSLKKGHFLSFIKESFKSLKLLYLKRFCMVKAIKNLNCDVIISTRPLHNAMVGKYGSKEALKIAWEHSHHNNNTKYINEVTESCKGIDYLVCVSKELTAFYADKLPSTTKCVHISLALDEIPNGVSSLNEKEITAIGRLSKEKGFLDLIDVFKLVNEKLPDWRLNIVGDGLEKEKIIKQIKTNKLTEAITMHGFKDKQVVNEILSKSSIYVMTSFTESFGLVLIEAMSYGLPCIAFDSARGSHEIIDNEINGFLVEKRDKQAMADKIIDLAKNAKLRKQMGNNAKNKSLLFESSKIKKEWLKLIKK